LVVIDPSCAFQGDLYDTYFNASAVLVRHN